MHERQKYMKFTLVIVAVIIGLGGLFFATQTTGTKNKNSAPSLTIQTIKNDVANGGQLIDVRTPDEYASGHIDGAINLSLQDIQAGTTPTIAKDKPVYLYCHSGNRSSQATAILKTAGYRDVIDVGAIAHVQTLGGIIKT